MTTLLQKTVCTIFCKSQLAEVRTLHELLGTHSPNINFVALLLDEPDDYFAPELEDFNCLSLQKCKLGHLKKIYSQAFAAEDFALLVRPFFLEHLFKTGKHSEVLYLSPRTYITGDISGIFKLPEQKSVGLFAQIDHEKRVTRDLKLFDSVFRRDLILLKNSEEAQHFLAWWQQMISVHFRSDMNIMDSLPFIFDFVHGSPAKIFDLGSYRAYMVDNALDETENDSARLVENSFLGFYLDLNWDALTDWRPKLLPDLVPIFRKYRELLIKHNLSETKYFPYSHDFLESGVVIPPILRECFRTYLKTFKEVHSACSLEEFVFTRNEKLHGHSLPPILKYLHERRRDLQDVFKNLNNPEPFITWMTLHGTHEYQLSTLWNKYLPKINEASASQVLRWISERPDLRQAFPQAFSSKTENLRLADWVESRACIEFGISSDVRNIVLEMLRQPLGKAAGHLLQSSSDLQAQFPLGLTQVQAKTFIEHVSQNGSYARRHDPKWIEWFHCAVGKDWCADLVETWKRNRLLRAQFPLGLTPFGSQPFLNHISVMASQIDPTQDWAFIKKLDIALSSSITSQLRALFRHDPDFGKIFPGLIQDGRVNKPYLLSNTSILRSWLSERITDANLRKNWLSLFDQEIQQFLRDNRIEVNYIGLIAGSTGLGSAARSHIAALKSSGASVNELEIAVNQKYCIEPQSKTQAEVVADTNIIHCNQDILKEAISQTSCRNFCGRKNIAYMVWELEQFNPALQLEDYLDEIWTPSAFSAAAISAAVRVPVQIMPHPIAVPSERQSMREELNIPKTTFMYLFITDAKSRLYRKNVAALIRAFEKSLQSDDRDCCLVLKISDPWVEEHEVSKLQEMAKHLPVKFIWDCLPSAQLYGLMEDCDAYVSLHRAEGFGLTLAEAMALGKPVIATGYSGNMEFMTVNNSLPVRYEFSAAPEYDEFYGMSHFAEPSVEHAAEMMSMIRTQPDLAKQIGARAAEDIKIFFSKEKIGKRMLDRLTLLRTTGAASEPRAENQTSQSSLKSPQVTTKLPQNEPVLSMHKDKATANDLVSAAEEDLLPGALPSKA
jgi:glycosyltransferase involved in cell wall biosynthesis